MSKVQEENKALVRRFVEAQAKGDLDAVKEMMAPDFVARSLLPGQEPDRNGYLRATAEYHAAFSGIRYIIEKQLAEGDEVVTSFSAPYPRSRVRSVRANWPRARVDGDFHPPHSRR